MGNINSNLVITSSIDNYLSEIEGFKYKKRLILSKQFFFFFFFFLKYITNFEVLINLNKKKLKYQFY